MLRKIGINSYPTVQTDYTVRIARNVDHPVPEIIAADGPGQGNAAAGRPDPYRKLADFRICQVLLPDSTGYSTVR